jgi:NAD-dependent histone deacetylase SIR2
MKAVYLNLDFPVPTREWEGVFDVWLQGDAQLFAQTLQEELEKQAKAKEQAIEKKRKRDEEVALAAATAANLSIEDTSLPPQLQPFVTAKPTKRKPSTDPATSKRRKIVAPPSPPKSPQMLHANPDPVDMEDDINIDDDYDVLPSLSSGAGPSSSSSSYTSPSSSPLLIRIPPRSRCYVDIPPPGPRMFLSMLQTPRRPCQPLMQFPPTPEDTPPYRFKFPRSHSPHTSVNDLTSSIDVIEIGLSEDEIYDHDTLPISCMRSTQIGLSYPDHG